MRRQRFRLQLEVAPERPHMARMPHQRGALRVDVRHQHDAPPRFALRRRDGNQVRARPLRKQAHHIPAAARQPPEHRQRQQSASRAHPPEHRRVQPAQHSGRYKQRGDRQPRRRERRHTAERLLEDRQPLVRLQTAMQVLTQARFGVRRCGTRPKRMDERRESGTLRASGYRFAPENEVPPACRLLMQTGGTHAPINRARLQVDAPLIVVDGAVGLGEAHMLGVSVRVQRRCAALIARFGNLLVPVAAVGGVREQATRGAARPSDQW